MIVKFKCGFCKDDLARTRRGMRAHLGDKHLRNQYFRIGKDRRPQIIRGVSSE